MATETITLEIDPEDARALKSVTSADWSKLRIFFRIWLKEYAKASNTSLRETMNEISEKAKSRGLTPEILDSMLRQK